LAIDHWRRGVGCKDASKHRLARQIRDPCETIRLPRSVEHRRRKLVRSQPNGERESRELRADEQRLGHQSLK
jgi:hypothetical protein